METKICLRIHKTRILKIKMDFSIKLSICDEETDWLVTTNHLGSEGIESY